MKIKRVKFKNAYNEWSRFQHLLNEEMDSVSNFPCDEEEDLKGLYWKRIKQTDEQYCLFLVDKNEKTVGMLTYAGYKKHINIRDFYIIQEYRNKGLGTLLLQEVKKEKHGRVLYVGTVGGNEKVLNLYKRLGFNILSYSMQMN